MLAKCFTSKKNLPSTSSIFQFTAAKSVSLSFEDTLQTLFQLLSWIFSHKTWFNSIWRGYKLHTAWSCSQTRQWRKNIFSWQRKIPNQNLHSWEEAVDICARINGFLPYFAARGNGKTDCHHQIDIISSTTSGHMYWPHTIQGKFMTFYSCANIHLSASAALSKLWQEMNANSKLRLVWTWK